MRTAMGVTCVLVLLGATSTAIAETTSSSGEHAVLTPQHIRWPAAPPVLPKGAEMSVLYGDPSKEGLFVMRVKLPGGYRLAPHSHSAAELVTVVSGTFKLGFGENEDKSQARALPAGSFFGLSPGSPHFAYTDEETVLQISAAGPWGLTYVNPQDDPRSKSQ